MDQLFEQVFSMACTAGGAGIGLLFAFVIFKQFLHIGRPNELLVFSGRNRKLADGSSVGYREVIGGGWTWRRPILEKADRMALTAIPIEISTSGAYSKGGIALNVHAVANVKVSSDRKHVKNAIERFMGRDPNEIKRVAKETLEGHLRGVLAQLTPEEVNEDRLKFAEEMVNEAEIDFMKLGLHLDTFKIQNVSDDVNYLDSIGRSEIAQVVRDAEIAESNNMAEAKLVEAAATESANVAVQQSEEAIIAKTNQLRELKGKLDADVDAATKQAAKAAAQARALAEVELQDLRRKVEELRLQADVVLPAEAAKEVAIFDARGAAAAIEEEGKAMAAVLQMMTDTWHSAGGDAKDIFLIQQLEQVLQTVVERVHNLKIQEVTLLDGGDGEALPRHISSYPAMVRQVLEELHTSTGVDVTGILAGAASGNKERS